MRLLLPYLVSAAAFLVIDLIWLGVIAKDFYRRELGALMLDKINIPVALIFYVIFPVGLTIFAVGPALDQGGVWRAFTLGALFGFFAYATYDLTNLATLKNWPLAMSLADMAWGALLSGTCAAIGTWAALR
jgi:uncharacterized membrane protein